MKTQEITNNENIIDSRDIIARIDHLENERATITDRIEELQADSATDHVSEIAEAQDQVKGWDESEEGRELAALRALAEDCEDYSADWRHGATLIRGSHFEDYARELAEDIGAIQRDQSWPYTCIDWEKAAQELQTDYTSADFDGVTYFIR